MRSDKKIFGYNRTQIVLVFLMAIMVISVFGYSATSFFSGENTKTQVIQVEAAVVFSNMDVVSQYFELNASETAGEVFSRFAQLEGVNTQSGTIITKVTTENYAAAENETNRWMFYVNGGIAPLTVDKYQVKDRDILELHFEEKL